MMGLDSRWDRCALLFFLGLAVSAMVGCQALFGGGSTPTSGTVFAGSAKLDFGTAVVGSKKQLTDTLTNGSAASVTISSDASTDASFQVTAQATPFSLAPGQTATLTVAFFPDAAGKPSGTIAIKSNEASSDEIDLRFPPVR
jgi:hypothetical protein